MMAQVAKSVSLLSIGFMTVLLNLTEVVTIMKNISGKSSFEIILLSLSFADLFVGCGMLLSGTDNLFYHMLQVHFDKDAIMYTLGQIIFALCFWASFQHILLIATERFIAVYFPIPHLVFISEKKNSKILIFGLWIISLCMVPIYYLKRREFIILSLVITYVSVGVMLIIYGLITRKIKVRKTMQGRSSGLRQHRSSHGGSSSVQSLVALNSSMVVACFLMCTCPWMITTTLLVLANYLNVEAAQLFVTIYVLPFNSLLDPLVYFWVFYFKKGNKLVARN